jgi:hypothetical protein
MIDINDFIEIHQSHIYEYQKRIQECVNNGTLLMSNSGYFYYSNQCNYFVTPNFIIAELTGYSKYPEKLIPNIIKIDRDDGFFDLFNEGTQDILFNIGGDNNRFYNFGFGRPEDIELIEKRFGIKKLYPASALIRKGNGALAHIEPKVKNFFINKCVLLSRKENFFRFRYVLNAILFNKNTNNEEFEKYLIDLITETPSDDTKLMGISFSKKQLGDLIEVSIQFASLFLTPDVTEKMIDLFISKHKNYFNLIFNSNTILNQMDLKWIEGNPDSTEKYIKPDMFISRKDGYYDICDLKLPLLQKETITKGGHKRRRFIDYINEGISQLANYREYFNYENNRIYAEKKYGIKINNPKLILIVGNYENFHIDEINEALRPYEKDIIIMDYDGINRILMQKGKN